MITKVRMDGQRRIRIPKKSGVKGETFLLLTLGAYYILFPIQKEKPELDIQGKIGDLLAQVDSDIMEDITQRWRRKEQDVD